MKKDFCTFHTERFLARYQDQKIALDLALSNYFKAHPALGSKDRKKIGSNVYGLARHLGLFQFLLPKATSWIDYLYLYESPRFLDILKEASIPEALRLGHPEWLYQKWIQQYGKEKARSIAQTFLEQAPTTIRANPIKTTREALFELLQKDFTISLCKKAPLGIQFQERAPLFSLEIFKQGYFEVQDEGSQLIADLVEAKPHHKILDFCSGSGGKTLAFAHKMQKKGEIYLHDIRLSALDEAKKRLKRAGIQNAQCLPPDHPQLKKLEHRCDIVLIDVPCSGTGTFRRNPEQKWNLNPEKLQQLIQEQRSISQKAISFLKDDGTLIYATCSILKEENEDQVSWIEKNLGLEVVSPPLSLLPESGGMDGFFAAVFKKSKERR